MGKRPRSYRFGGQNLAGGWDEGGVRFLRPGGTSYGPYWSLSSGKYRAVIAGENMEAAELEVYSDFGERKHPFAKSVSGAEILLDFSLSKAVRNLEVVVRNRSAQEMRISSLVIAPADE